MGDIALETRHLREGTAKDEGRAAAGTTARLRAALVRLQPWLARAAAAPDHVLPEETSEDLAQSVLASCLARIEHHERTGSLPAWCEDEQRLRRYLAGALTRHRARRWRDHRRAVGLPPDLRVPVSEPREACSCLRCLSDDERRLLETPREQRGEFARALGLILPTLEKRRRRLIQRLRVRCRSCARRRDGKCDWLGLIP